MGVRIDQCYASADEGSNAPHRRPGASPINPVNNVLAGMREFWPGMTVEEKLTQLRGELLFLADPVSHMDEHDHVTLADLTLGELYHARVVITRLLAWMQAELEAG